MKEKKNEPMRGDLKRIPSHGWTKTLTDLFYPRRCPICQRILKADEIYVCPSCGRKLPWVREPVCIRCGKPLEDPGRALCADCARIDHAFDEGRAVFLYEKGIRLSVNRMKFYNHREYIPFYAAALFSGAASYLRIWKPACIIPIPMHPKKRAERGFDQTVLLAEEFSRLTKIPVLDGCLIRTRYTKASRKLGREHRLANLRGAFRVREGVRIPEPVLLLFYIYTTGTTMDNASRTLRKAGVTRICFLTLCTGRGAG